MELGRQLVERLCPVRAVAVSVSREKHGMGGLNDGYYEVLEVLGIIDMQNLKDKAISYDELDAATYQRMDTTFERDRRLINRVLEGDRDGVLEALALRSASGALDSRNTLMLEKRRLLGLVNQMTAEITSGGDTDFLSELDAFRKIMDAPAAEQLSATFRSVALGLCDYFSHAQEDLGASERCGLRTMWTGIMQTRISALMRCLPCSRSALPISPGSSSGRREPACYPISSISALPKPWYCWEQQI